MTTTIRALAVMALASLAGAACSTTRAATPIEHPALEVPPVPARIVEPVRLPPPQQGLEPVSDLPAAPSSSGPARTKPAAPKPDPKSEAPPTDPPAAQPTAQPTVPPLRTPGTPDADEATRRIRGISSRAQSILNTTDFHALNPERQAQYQNAQLLISQTEDAIKANNYEFATNLAEKAERLAKELQNRLSR